MKQRLLVAIGAALLGGLGCRDDAQAPTELSPAGPEAVLVSTATPLAFLQLSAGSFYTCGVARDHRAYCWGDNANGQLGIGTLWEPEFCHETSTCSRFPIAVAGGLTFKQVATNDAGHHACGITTDSSAYCWGPGNWGQLGDGTLNDHYAPTRVATSLRFRQVSVGIDHSCGVTTGNRAYCWGQGNLVGSGSGASTPTTGPVAVAGGLYFKQVSAAGNHTCGLTTTNRAYCWGGNGHGGLGDGSVARRLRPVRVHTGLRFRQLDTGFNYTCAVTVDYRGFCWGVNDHGQLGDGTTTTRLSPQAVAGGVSFERVTAGFDFTCGETTTNRAYCWGSNSSGQLGDGTSRTLRLKPTAVTGGLFFRQLSAGGVHTCGRASTDLAYCWGLNSEAELGDGTRTDRLRPRAVAAPQ